MFVLLLSVICNADSPKFHFMECVKVVSGFFAGCKGNVKSYSAESFGTKPGTYNGPNSTYQVEVTDCKGQSFFEYFKESELESCKKVK